MQIFIDKIREIVNLKVIKSKLESRKNYVIFSQTTCLLTLEL